MSLDFREAACSCMMQMFGRAMGITAVEDLYRSEVAGDWLKSTATYTIKCVYLYVNCFPVVTGANTKMNSWIRVITSSLCWWGSWDAERLNQLLKVTQLPNVRAGTLRDHLYHPGHIQFQPKLRFANGQINGLGCTLQHPWNQHTENSRY